MRPRRWIAILFPVVALATTPLLALGTIETGDARFAWLNFGTNGEAADEPDLGLGYHYLVTGANACGESGAGTSSSGEPHAVTPCP